MAIYNDIVVTNAGSQLLRDTSASDRKLTAETVVTSASKVSDPSSAIVIPNVVQTQAYTLYPTSNNQFVLEAQLTNANVLTPYLLNTIGFYASDGVSAPILLAVITASEPDSVPGVGNYPVNINFKAIITITNGGEVEINPSFAGFVSQEEFSETKTELQAAIDNQIVFSPTRPAGNWKIWLQDLGPVPDYPEDPAGETLTIDTAPLDAPGDFALMTDDVTGETVLNMTDNPETAGDDDLIITEE